MVLKADLLGDLLCNPPEEVGEGLSELITAGVVLGDLMLDQVG